MTRHQRMWHWMKAQISVELMLNLIVWLTFISILTSSVLLINKNVEMRIGMLDFASKVHSIANGIEAMQATGFSVVAEVPLHKYKNGFVTLDYNGKEIVEKTIFGVDEIHGQPM